MTVTCTPPRNVNATLLPVYSGFITLSSGQIHNNLNIPYLGVAGSMRSTPVLQPSQVYLARDYNPVPANSTYVFARPDPANPPAVDRGDEATEPNVYIKPTVGARVLRVDVVSGDAVVGSLAGWPQMNLARAEVRAWFHGLTADGKVLGEGRYKLRIMVLRIFGDQEDEEDWEIYDTVEFSFTYKG